MELAYKQEVDEMKTNLLAGKEKVLNVDDYMYTYMYMDGNCLESRYLVFAYGCSPRKSLFSDTSKSWTVLGPVFWRRKKRWSRRHLNNYM